LKPPQIEMTVKQFTAAEVTKHNTENNGWIIVPVRSMEVADK